MRPQGSRSGFRWRSSPSGCSRCSTGGSSRRHRCYFGERVFPMAQLADAHRLLESNDTFGKLIVSW